MSRLPFGDSLKNKQKGGERPNFLDEDRWNQRNGDHFLAAQKRTRKFDNLAAAQEPSVEKPQRASHDGSNSFAVAGAEATILGPSVLQDTTIHLQLDIEHDVEIRLEEFSRLKRLGDFSGAHKYFEENLQEFIHASAVSVELADMLLAQGAYKRLRELRMRKELKPPRTPDEVIGRKHESRSDGHFRSLPNRSDTKSQISNVAEQPEGGVDRFDITFLLIEAASSMYSEGSLRRALRLAKPTILELKPNSTSVRIPGSPSLKFLLIYVSEVAKHTAFSGNPDICQGRVQAC